MLAHYICRTDREEGKSGEDMVLVTRVCCEHYCRALNISYCLSVNPQAVLDRIDRLKSKISDSKDKRIYLTDKLSLLLFLAD